MSNDLRTIKSQGYLVGLTLAVSFLVVAHVQADIVTSQNYTYALSTSDASGWEYAGIFTMYDAGYVNPVRGSGNTYTSVGTRWSDHEGSLDWSTVNWTEATQGTRYTFGGNYTTPDLWIAATDSNTDNHAPNGFFGFKYTLHATGSETAVSGTLDLNLMSDDYITAIYANGHLLYSSVLRVGDPATDMGWTTLSSLAFDVDLINAQLDLIFVVHNNNLGGSTNLNAMGLYADGWLSTDVYLESGPPGTPVVPEPATMLIFGLGATGLGLAAARRHRR